MVSLMGYAEKIKPSEWAAHCPWLRLTAYGETRNDAVEALTKLVRTEWGQGLRPEYYDPPQMFQISWPDDES